MKAAPIGKSCTNMNCKIVCLRTPQGYHGQFPSDSYAKFLKNRAAEEMATMPASVPAQRRQ
eukprot:2286501-Pyramimonas_sp.AAC.1